MARLHVVEDSFSRVHDALARDSESRMIEAMLP